MRAMVSARGSLITTGAKLLGSSFFSAASRGDAIARIKISPKIKVLAVRTRPLIFRFIFNSPMATHLSVWLEILNFRFLTYPPACQYLGWCAAVTSNFCIIYISLYILFTYILIYLLSSFDH